MEFGEDLQPYEVRQHLTQLPQEVKHRLRGRTLIVESSEEFELWLGNATLGRRSQGLWGRLLRRWDSKHD